MVSRGGPEAFYIWRTGCGVLCLTLDDVRLMKERSSASEPEQKLRSGDAMENYTVP